jgi:hypothetical protein
MSESHAVGGAMSHRWGAGKPVTYPGYSNTSCSGFAGGDELLWRTMHGSELADVAKWGMLSPCMEWYALY